MPPEISVVLCTRNRASQLKPTLISFTRLDFPGTWELILVNNGSTDETAAVISAFIRAHALAVIDLVEPVPGLSRARNRGLAHARAPLVAFTDDDCYPAADYLTALRRCFADPSVAFCGGRVLLYDPTDLRITIQESTVPRDIPPLSFIPSGLIHGANMAFRRDVLLAINGFDERLGSGTLFPAGEDTDALVRCSAAGYFGRYDPAIVVYHHHRRKTAKDRAQLMRNYWRGRGACAGKYCLNPRTRALYLRHFYWDLRTSRFDQAMTEIGSALWFFFRSGMTMKKIWHHPHRSLARTD